MTSQLAEASLRLLWSTAFHPYGHGLIAKRPISCLLSTAVIHGKTWGPESTKCYSISELPVPAFQEVQKKPKKLKLDSSGLWEVWENQHTNEKLLVYKGVVECVRKYEVT